MIQCVFSYSPLLLCEILLAYCAAQRAWGKKDGGRSPPRLLPPLWKADGIAVSTRQKISADSTMNRRSYRKNTNAPPSPYGKNRALIFRLFHTERTPAAVCPPSCNSPASRHGAIAPRLLPTFSEPAFQWLTFVTQLALFRCILAPTVPFAWGFYPVLSEPPPD